MTTMPPDPNSPRLTARHLYWQGWRVARIAEFIGQKPSTVHSWKDRDGWEQASPTERVEGALEARLIQLIGKEAKEGRDFKEIDLLGRQIERLARVHRYQETGKESDLNPNITARNDAPRRKQKRNALTDEQVEALEAAFLESLFEYQHQWHEAGHKHRIRNILKSRQIGATWYFAREAIVDAFKTGRNKIFLSASKAQAHIFRNYIVQFVKEVTDVELKRSPLVLDNGAELHFLGTNSKTAQGYHGDVYLDEYFWIHRFQEFRKVTSGMAIHKKWRQTYFSTPSSLGHEAYPFWSGELFNKRRAKKDRVEFDVSHAACAGGQLCADGQWRQIVTVEDAIAGGCDLFDLDQLRLEYSDEEFANLLMCQFVDDSQSAFPLAMVHPCMVDSWEDWDDFRPFAPRPVGDRGVWVGYDPTGTGEDVRFICVGLMKYIAPEKLLAVLAMVAALLVLVLMSVGGVTGAYALVGISACMSLMFPTIFGLSLQDLGGDSKFGGSCLIMAILGGAVLTAVMGKLSDSMGIQAAFVIPLIGFAYLVYFGLKGYQIEK